MSAANGADSLIAQTLDESGTLVVPTSSRAAAIEIACARKQIERGRSAWRTPDVIGYRSWLEREAYRAADAGQSIARPLRGAEEWLLWREATTAAAQAEGFESSDSLAERLQRAAQTLHEWDISPGELRASARAESRLLAGALAAVDAHARDLHAVGTHRLAALLRAWRPSSAVTFAGFVDRSAARGALVRAWSEGAGQCREHAPSVAGAESSQARSVCAGDIEEELELSAHWCRARLVDDPHARLLVVVPDLAQRYTQALHVFERALAPRALRASGTGAPRLVALEGGMPLANEPIVRHALATLEFLLGRAEVEVVSAWLRAAFWSSPSPVARAALDAALRERLGVEVAPTDLLAALASTPATLGDSAERLASAIGAALEVLHASQPPAPLLEWARRFERALHALGWPGERAISAREQQSVAQLREVLDDLAAIGGRVGWVTASEALRALRGLAGRRALHLAPSDVPVTLCGTLADPIVRYDGIWVAGLHADAWPPPARVDPFIPFGAQRRAGIPSANPAAKLAQARDVLQRYRLATAHLMLSWPAQGDEGEHVASPLIAECAPSAAVQAPTESLARSIRVSRRIETFEDRRGEAWPAARPLPSGSRAIEYQSRCAFRAYAELRLRSVPLGEPRPGIRTLDRGRLLHRALELAWSALGSSDALEAASRDGTLAQLIEMSVQRAGDEVLPAPSDAAGRAAQRRERRRAARLLEELAQLERQRPPFRVRATELRRRLEIEGASLDVRIDRIDELADGSWAFFDYKTGLPASVDWLDERIGNTQLLVYSLAAESIPTALAMIQLTPRRISYRGMAERRDRLPKIDAPRDAALWGQQLERWRDAVGRLARAFLRGEAGVEPLGDTCAACHLHGFCRIHD
ncbi:MAG TPA: PD-(D/E)XK nuclease family protein [Steroidobacteraceae bacterium]|nr:PD-(D/E)XK nuclease family protein [Steroidobacteraceae bacterium]